MAVNAAACGFVQRNALKPLSFVKLIFYRFGVQAGVKAYDVIGDDLAVRWEDGSESYIPLRELRLRCPCAACAGEKDLLGREHRMPRDLTAGSFILTKVQRVGGYALQPTWADGHQTGLYSFAYLRSLTRAAE